MTDDQIKRMAERFLCWKLPADFHPDGGISFEPVGNSGVEGYEYRQEPVGTNLFTFTQAVNMIHHMIGGDV